MLGDSQGKHCLQGRRRGHAKQDLLRSAQEKGLGEKIQLLQLYDEEEASVHQGLAPAHLLRIQERPPVDPPREEEATLDMPVPTRRRITVPPGEFPRRPRRTWAKSLGAAAAASARGALRA